MDVVENTVRRALRTVDDPELGVNVVDLGLVRSVAIDEDRVDIVMMMTTPTCPIGSLIAETAKVAVESRIGGNWRVSVSLDRSAEWSPALASPEVRAHFEPHPSAVAGALKAAFSRLFKLA
ncbi:metal-sulfur cluster assembly factor [Aurantimonas sp. VKM B-3413]|uniref:metal-sulfur cluster assembly factor n=1 Tax=Aurantimonas sp. VKM B-3413 TaxID=2779401 RepID=UPI001E3A7F02|nr:metal-sulfur cluster assembly factor [Aurantimonas sp. VKM B-3413]MCB8836777.1 metal-sulfur cluster assembly factor [Aurantimonas sp. VKM B-3413]